MSLATYSSIAAFLAHYDVLRAAHADGTPAASAPDPDDAPVVALAGWQVDQAARNIIQKMGFGDYFIHRTGHSIGTDVHSNGANMDDLEIHDERLIQPNSCFSVEPGVYLPEFGVRLEVDVLVRPGSAEVTGKIQSEIVII